MQGGLALVVLGALLLILASSLSSLPPGRTLRPSPAVDAVRSQGALSEPFIYQPAKTLARLQEFDQSTEIWIPSVAFAQGVSIRRARTSR